MALNSGCSPPYIQYAHVAKLSIHTQKSTLSNICEKFLFLSAWMYSMDICFLDIVQSTSI